MFVSSPIEDHTNNVFAKSKVKLLVYGLQGVQMHAPTILHSSGFCDEKLKIYVMQPISKFWEVENTCCLGM